MGQQIIIGRRQLSCANPDTADVDFIAQFPGKNRAGQIGYTPTGAAGSSLSASALPAGASMAKLKLMPVGTGLEVERKSGTLVKG